MSGVYIVVPESLKMLGCLWLSPYLSPLVCVCARRCIVVSFHLLFLPVFFVWFFFCFFARFSFYSPLPISPAKCSETIFVFCICVVGYFFPEIPNFFFSVLGCCFSERKIPPLNPPPYNANYQWNFSVDPLCCSQIPSNWEQEREWKGGSCVTSLTYI